MLTVVSVAMKVLHRRDTLAIIKATYHVFLLWRLQAVEKCRETKCSYIFEVSSYTVFRRSTRPVVSVVCWFFFEDSGTSWTVESDDPQQVVQVPNRCILFERVCSFVGLKIKD